MLWEPRLVGEGTLVCSLHLTDVHGGGGIRSPRSQGQRSKVTGLEAAGHLVSGLLGAGRPGSAAVSVVPPGSCRLGGCLSISGGGPQGGGAVQEGRGLGRTWRDTCVRLGAPRPPEEGGDHFEVVASGVKGGGAGLGALGSGGPGEGRDLREERASGQRRPR